LAQAVVVGEELRRVEFLGLRLEKPSEDELRRELGW
jgi:hypothetical protein